MRQALTWMPLWNIVNEVHDGGAKHCRLREGNGMMHAGARDSIRQLMGRGAVVCGGAPENST
jgi:hypothetical protein